MKITAASTAIWQPCFLISPQMLWKHSHPEEMIKEAGIHLDTTPSHLASEGSSHWMDRLKNIAAMLDTDQHSHSIIISLMIAHECFWMLHLAPRMMEVVVCIHPHFPGCQKIAFGESRTPLIKSHNLLVKAGVLSVCGRLPGVIIARWFGSPVIPPVKMEHRPASQALCTLLSKSSHLRWKL